VTTLFGWMVKETMPVASTFMLDISAFPSSVVVSYGVEMCRASSGSRSRLSEESAGLDIVPAASALVANAVIS
jgi:hypothetical protein